MTLFPTEKGCIYQVQKKKADQEIQRDVSYLTSKCKQLEEKISASDESDEPQDNAGNQFGDHKGKNQQKISD